MDSWDDFLKDRRIGLQQTKPPEGIAAVGRPASLLVDTRRDHYHGRPRQIRIVAVAHRNRWRKNSAVLDVCHDTLGALAISVHEHDLTRASPHHRSEERRVGKECRSMWSL